ncbi:hypothetical protein [Azospirillum sp.]|uniref:hypothetical protein n=1 Tax=Azospirillum sp. TaxID=34012 RepID=UPI003D71D0D7
MKTNAIRPCPPNGLARAAWCREVAAMPGIPEWIRERELACAEAIERRVFNSLPLIARMQGGEPVGTALVPSCRPAAREDG